MITYVLNIWFLSFYFFLHITQLFYIKICLSSNGLLVEEYICKICSHHDIGELLLKLALNTNKSITCNRLFIFTLSHRFIAIRRIAFNLFTLTWHLQCFNTCNWKCWPTDGKICKHYQQSKQLFITSNHGPKNRSGFGQKKMWWG